jgi:hypothetical protein
MNFWADVAFSTTSSSGASSKHQVILNSSATVGFGLGALTATEQSNHAVTWAPQTAWAGHVPFSRRGTLSNPGSPALYRRFVAQARPMASAVKANWNKGAV